MNGLLTILENSLQAAWAERVGWTLLHSLWQIALVAGAYAAASFLLRNRSASSRYLVGCAAMVAMLALPMITFGLLPQRETPTAAATLEPLAAPIEIAETPVWEGDIVNTNIADSPIVSTMPEPETAPAAVEKPPVDVASALRPYLPWATAVWLAGVLLLSLRPVWGWLHVRRLQRTGLSQLPNNVRQVAGDLIERLGVRRAVRFAQSALVEVPTVVGYLRPLVLLPASAITGLSASELELILAHELAHVRRHDYVVNLAQTVAESLLFYHPGMWWVSNQIRQERENCCDDMAVALTGDRATYVRALTRLEEQRATTPAAVLAATGGSLIQRVRRLLGKPAADSGYRSATTWLAGLLTIGIVAAALAMNGEAQGDSQDSTGNSVEADEFGKAIADGVAQVLKSHEIPFMTDARLKTIRAEFAALVEKYQRDDLSDQRKQAILTALEKHGSDHLRLGSFQPDNHWSLNLAYLKLPDRLMTLQWKVWKAISLSPLSPKEQQRLNNQRRWMTNYINGLPPYHTFTNAAALAELTERFNDPLCSTLDRPMSDTRFVDFQERLQKYPRDKALANVVTHIVQKSLYAQYNNFHEFELPFEDRIYGYGAGRFAHLIFVSNRQHRGGIRALREIDNSYSVVDAMTGHLVSKPKNINGPKQFRSWLNKNGKGDFAFDKDAGNECNLFAVRGAKLVGLDADNWLEADAISNETLLALFNEQGTDSVLLTPYYLVHRDPSAIYIGPYIAVLTKEGRLAVVHVEDFSGPGEIHYRVRSRAEENASMPKGLGFLNGIPEFADLRIDMTEPQLKEILARRQLVFEVGTRRNGRSTDYRISTPSGKNVIVMFRDGECSGIQRMRDRQGQVVAHSVPIKQLPVEGDVHRWRIENAKGLRIGKGIVAIETVGGSGRIGVVEHVGGTNGQPYDGPIELQLEVSLKDGFLHWKRSESRQNNTLVSLVESKTRVPAGSRMQIVPWGARDWPVSGNKRDGRRDDPRLATDEYANLWEARFVRNGQVLKSIVFVARLIEAEETAPPKGYLFSPVLADASAIPAADPTARATRLLAEREKKSPKETVEADEMREEIADRVVRLRLGYVNKEGEVFDVASGVRDVSIAVADGAAALPDGIYRVRPADSKEEGTEVLRSDADEKMTVVLLNRMSKNFGTARMWSTSNDNTRFYIDLKSSGPFAERDDIGHFAMVLDGLCMMVGSHSDPDKDGRMNMMAQVVGKEVSARIAARLGVTPHLRQNPGHKMEVRFSPTKETFRLGEPIVLKLTIKNVGDKLFTFMDGGQQRGPRNNQFGFTAFRDGGKGPEVPDTGDPINFGGMGVFRTLKPGELFEKQIDINDWFDLNQPDTYKINGQFELEINAGEVGSYPIDWEDVARADCLVVVVGAEPDE